VTEASLAPESSARADRLDVPARRARTRTAVAPAYHPAHGMGGAQGKTGSPELFLELIKASDTAAVLLSLGLVTAGLAMAGTGPGWGWGVAAVLAIAALVWRLVFLVTGMYADPASPTWKEELPGVAAAVFVGAGALVPAAGLAGGWAGILALAPAYPLIVAATLGGRSLLRSSAAGAVKGAHRVVIVGSGPLALEMHRRLSADASSGYELLGFVDSAPHIRFGEVADRLIGSLEDLDHILMHNVVDEVMIALPVKSHYDSVQQAIEICESAGIQASYGADIFRPTLGAIRYRPSGAQPTVAVQVVADDYRLSVKRALDILGAGIGLMLLTPLMLAVALAVKVSSPGPVFYRQERYGWRKRRFRMMKFRTMIADAEILQSTLEERNEATGPVFKIRNDPRMTPIGRFLRATSLDELPQLWNVLRGDMSLVGPRPLPVRDVGRFDQSWLMRRFSVLPGMTGLWQVSGRSDLGFGDWAALDLEYIDRWSLRLDLEILVRTFPAVLNGVGAR
jgi:exopolysaccharide biosynthesis polyprenyl glycosylphosphotransferase